MSSAKLTVILKVDDIVVAESEDPILWQRLLGVIQSGGALQEPMPGRSEAPSFQIEHEEEGDPSVARFAKALKVSVADLLGALSPSKEAPYLTLNMHNWEAFKKAVPARGIDAVSPIGLAGTALALWIKEAKLDVAPTQALALQVLGTINIRDPNASRGIKNTKWLMVRAGGTISINPAQVSKALDVIRSFCLMRKPGIEV
ncbi:MAG TPA: hypothetical protein VG943_18880 [Caulobacterales bacterium]|nr:hypothetical protein [Caulobacterales bacterium]